MFYGKSRRIIVIKDIHSNLFEEAILVLREDTEQGKGKGIAAKMEKSNEKGNNYILKEAELIISNYIKDNKSLFTGNLKVEQGQSKKNEKVSKIKDKEFMKNLIINSALLGSIAAVAFIIIQCLWLGIIEYIVKCMYVNLIIILDFIDF